MKSTTVIVDLDGVILHHYGAPSYSWQTYELNPGVLLKFDEWEMEGTCIIIMTARKECCRKELEIELRKLGLFWDQLIMGVTSGDRVLYNDMKGTNYSAFAVNVERNRGLGPTEY